MKLNILYAVLLLVGVGLAGCTEEPPEEPQLKAGTGAISGLLVDDRYRPIQLVDSVQSDFQAAGFVLLQENGEQAQTNENGEFAFRDLEPGPYTIRVTAAGHEATPQTIQVKEGEYAEISLVARRTATSNEFVITEEYTAFVGCQASVPAATAQCHQALLDQSGDTNRQGFLTNYTALEANLVIIEMLSNKEASRDGALKVVVRNATNDCYLVNWAITEGSYMKTWFKHGEVSPFDIELRNCMWTNEASQTIQIWAQGLLKDETQPLVEPICMTGACAGETAESRGAGVQAGLVVRFVVSVFLNQPDADPDSYCVLC